MENRPYACSECDYRATTNDSLQRHFAFKHSEEKPYKCTKCEFRTKTKGNLQIHQQKHSENRPFACTDCDYKAKTKTALHVHYKRIHEVQERKFNCDKCSYVAYRSIDLKTHSVVHETNRKTFMCQHCHKKYFSQSSLKNHVATKHGNLNFLLACEVCPYKAAFRSHLQKHIKQVHLNEKPFSCEFCDYATAVSRTLQVTYWLYTMEESTSSAITANTRLCMKQATNLIVCIKSTNRINKLHCVLLLSRLLTLFFTDCSTMRVDEPPLIHVAVNFGRRVGIV